MILAIDSSSLVASVAIMNEDVMIAEYTTNLKKTHSQTLLPMIDEIFKMTGVDKRETKAVAVTCGPGSFTGLRIGGATAKGIALAYDIPIIPVPTLEAMAYNFNYSDKIICPIMDARRNQVYTGVYRCRKNELEVISDTRAMDINDLLNELKGHGEDVVFVGDGIPVYKDVIAESLSDKALFAGPHMNRQKAGSVGTLGLIYLKQGKTVDGDEFAPVYYRLSQAERMKGKG